MEQLKMHWKNDGRAVAYPAVTAGVEIVRFPELSGAMDAWLDIVQYGLSEKREGPAYYRETMTALPHYSEDKCFFVLENGRAEATLTVVCDYERREGLIHMVACREDARGRGYGTLLCRLAEYVLKDEGMETAHLKTDDWRLPAIKGYLRIGFAPDLSTEDFCERWEKIYAAIGARK